MILRVDYASTVPIYEQICNQIILGIATGRLQNGEGLPAVRQLASELDVNPMTVNKAYGQLRQEGWIEIDRRHGAKVSVQRALFYQQRSSRELEEEVLLLAIKARRVGCSFETLKDLLEESIAKLEPFEALLEEGKER